MKTPCFSPNLEPFPPDLPAVSPRPSGGFHPMILASIVFEIWLGIESQPRLGRLSFRANPQAASAGPNELSSPRQQTNLNKNKWGKSPNPLGEITQTPRGIEGPRGGEWVPLGSAGGTYLEGSGTEVCWVGDEK